MRIQAARLRSGTTLPGAKTLRVITNAGPLGAGLRTIMSPAYFTGNNSRIWPSSTVFSAGAPVGG